MKRLTWLMLVAALAVLVAAPLMAAEGGAGDKPAKTAKERPAKDSLRGEYAIMASECKLTEQQQADLKAKVAARDEAMKAWETANAEKVKAFQEAARKAKESGDKEAAKRASEEMKPLMAEREKINASFMADVGALLNAEQKAAWDAFRVYRSAMGRYRRVNPTEEQTAKIKEVCAAAAKDMPAVQGDDKAARQARTEAEAKLRKTIEETILTAEQREQLAKKPEPKSAAAGEKPVKEK